MPPPYPHPTHTQRVHFHSQVKERRGDLDIGHSLSHKRLFFWQHLALNWNLKTERSGELKWYEKIQTKMTKEESRKVNCFLTLGHLGGYLNVITWKPTSPPYASSLSYLLLSSNNNLKRCTILLCRVVATNSIGSGPDKCNKRKQAFERWRKEWLKQTQNSVLTLFHNHIVKFPKNCQMDQTRYNYLTNYPCKRVERCSLIFCMQGDIFCIPCWWSSSPASSSKERAVSRALSFHAQSKLPVSCPLTSSIHPSIKTQCLLSWFSLPTSWE